MVVAAEGPRPAEVVAGHRVVSVAVVVPGMRRSLRATAAVATMEEAITVAVDPGSQFECRQKRRRPMRAAFALGVEFSMRH